MAVFMPRYPAKQGVSEAKLVFARETTMRPGRMPFLREPTISNLLLLGVGEIGTTGHLYFREQKNSSEARFADATTIDERQAGLSLL